MTTGIAMGAIILFIGTGGTVLPQLVRAWQGLASQPDLIFTNALLLNVALVLLGWNRLKALKAELETRRISEKEARRLADVDPLTGCYNRRSIGPEIANLIDDAKAIDNDVAVILLDLDNFKQVNDLNGHIIGDTVLKKIAERIADTLPADALLARLGGDEFACAIQYKSGQRDRVEHTAALLIDRTSKPLHLDDLSVEVTISIGIVGEADVETSGNRIEDAQQLIHKADIAMYQAKKQGKNRMFWFEPSMEYELRFRNDLENGIRKGIREGEFLPFYEQQIDLDTGDLVGFEMLARWQSPELGTVGPDVFIPIAEDIGLISELSEKLIAQAFQDARLWHPDLSLSVNISPVQLRDPWFSQKLVRLLVEHNFPASRLDIEITESCLHENIGMARNMITSLRNQGVRVSLDDFGTGYSSLAQLRTLPFDRIKIDRSFISELRDEGASEKLVDAIISMGNGLNMPITAEGIENDEILGVLKRMGQLKGQGYHYGRPEPAEAVRTRLAEAGLLVAEEEVAAMQPSDMLAMSREMPRRFSH
ncbi:putative bifunctional diguanylate cyclase/phosphodiesterase [Qipengyuania sp. DGS5-3]|uniref:putative bifunctional diguanylate cyclase/phosphodiesterase n=1 Tax=Qipengyuania sp. DGS5-3 TaxID=3349632 RepID=UPI0036D4354F